MLSHFAQLFGGQSDKSSLARQLERRRRSLRVEQLEARNMFAADLRLITELNNNLANATWGTVGTDLLRLSPAQYADGIDDPSGANRLSARAISNLLVAQPAGTPLNDRDMSAFVYAWGQFIDHDLDLSDDGTEAFNVLVPKGDSSFDPNNTGTQQILLNRSVFDPATGTSTTNPRQQTNSITAFLDGSMIYGSDDARAKALRTGVGGLLMTSAGNLLPFNTMGLSNADPLGLSADQLFVAGDVRANENIELTAMQTLFMREHNRLATMFAAKNPTWNDEQIYQEARKIVIAEIQSITYNEFLPALLGQNALTPYRGYNPNVNPGIANEFSTAAFRLGHSLVGDDVEFLDNNGNELRDAVELRDDFFAPQIIEENGIDGIMKYLATDRAQELDTHVVDDLRDFLFGQPGQGGLDLASLNIQRGRDHGLADYNTTRVAYGLKPVKSFADITSDVATQQVLKAAYGNVNNIDLWVGGLAEDHLPGSSVGATFTRIIADQFQRLRDGDRFWYQNSLNSSEMALVRGVGLNDIISRNTTTTNLQENVFFFKATIAGHVVANIDLGRRGTAPIGIPGITVQLRDGDGNILDTTTTGREGGYSFKSLDIGTYTVTLALPKGIVQVSDNPEDMTFTAGDVFRGIDFTIKSLRSNWLGDMQVNPTNWDPNPSGHPTIHG